jgi:hypothetical protein
MAEADRREPGLLDAPNGGAFTAPPRTRVWVEQPQSLPLEERVFPPRAPDAPVVISVQDGPTGGRAGAGWARAWASGWPPARLPTASWPARLPRRRRGPRRKNVLLAATLGLVLGPLGLAYAGLRHVLAAVVTGTVVFTSTVTLTLVVADAGAALLAAAVQALLVGPTCAVWGGVAATWHNTALARTTRPRELPGS